MPNDDQLGILETKVSRGGGVRRNRKPWIPPVWLEPVFIYIAFAVAAVAAVAFLLWILVTFVIPFNLYSRESTRLVLSNGQTLQVKYPNLVLAGETPTYINLILYGESRAVKPVSFKVKIPAGLIVVEPVEQAYSTKLDLPAPGLGSDTEPSQIKIGLLNTQSAWGLWVFKRQAIVITSSSLRHAETIYVGVETVPWVAAGRIVNGTINDKSTLILLVTGFLSGAGTLVLQYMKTQRDRLREDRHKTEDRFYEYLQEDFEGAINVFLRNKREIPEEDDTAIYQALVEQSNWYTKLSVNVRENLKKKEFHKARQIANTLRELCNLVLVPNDEEKIESQTLFELCELTLIDDPRKRILTIENASCLLISYKHWRELKPLITDLIHEFTYLTTNLPIIDEVFTSDNDGLLLLKDSSIQKIILQKIIDDRIANTEDHEDENKAANNISRYLTLDINWRPLWSGKERELSESTLRWLSRHWYEAGSIDDNISLGSEYAELDNKLRRLIIQHPVFELVHGPFPSIVFGEEGTGKTAAALWLANDYQVKAGADTKESKVFPVYAPFVSGVDITEWLVEKVARALINFTADNPRRFITASDSQKTAMGRLMLWHTQSVNALRLDFHSSPFNNDATDLEQALEYMLTLNYAMPSAKLTKEEMLNLLCMGWPDIFDQIYFLWDIRSAAPHEEVSNKIREIDGLALLLARQNLFIKIFAPLTAKNSLSNLSGFHHLPNDLTWNEPQLRQLIDARINMFEALWERGIDDPTGLVISSSINHSPRHTVRFLIRLMDYVGEYLQEGEKLNGQIFNKLTTTQYDGGDVRVQNRKQTTTNYENAVFVSYAWEDESERTVDDLEQAFAKHGISLERDKKSLDYKDSIEAFEQRIGRGQCVVLVISEKYLHSEHCMYELLVVDENQNLRDRIFPIVLADAGIYKPVDRLNHIKYWDDQIKKLNQEVKKVGVITNVDGIIADLKKYVRIRASFDHLSGLLSDMNALTPEMHAVHGFSAIITTVKKLIDVRSIQPNNQL